MLVGILVRLPEPLHEASEVGLRVQLQVAIVGIGTADDLPDQGILVDRHQREEEAKE